jgi:hypothetical protein
VSGFGFLGFLRFAGCSSSPSSLTRTTAPAKWPPAVINIAQVRPPGTLFCIDRISSIYELASILRGKIVLYIPICVDGGQWNHEIAVTGSPRPSASGDGDLVFSLLLFLTRALTASESDSSSSEEADPDRESSSPEHQYISCTQKNENNSIYPQSSLKIQPRRQAFRLLIASLRCTDASPI